MKSYEVTYTIVLEVDAHNKEEARYIADEDMEAGVLWRQADVNVKQIKIK